jgi:hypothetical protein
MNEKSDVQNIVLEKDVTPRPGAFYDRSLTPVPKPGSMDFRRDRHAGPTGEAFFDRMAVGFIASVKESRDPCQAAIINRVSSGTVESPEGATPATKPRAVSFLGSEKGLRRRRAQMRICLAVQLSLSWTTTWQSAKAWMAY